MSLTKKHEPVRIGFYVCHCGINIASMVDVRRRGQIRGHAAQRGRCRATTSTCAPIRARN